MTANDVDVRDIADFENSSQRVIKGGSGAASRGVSGTTQLARGGGANAVWRWTELQEHFDSVQRLFFDFW